jgi:hypothetical protein
MATWWPKYKIFNTVNVFSAAFLWALWKKRNNMCVFRQGGWTGMAKMMGSCVKLLKNLRLVRTIRTAHQR